MGFRKQFATDPKLERDGLWLDYGDGRRLLCARAGGANKHYQRTMESVAAPFRRAIETKTLPPEQAEKILVEVFARSVVRGWEGVTQDDLDGSGDQTPVSFSVENCMKFFAALPEVLADVRGQIVEAQLFRAVLDEDDSKNS
jgi:hypothetical protein